MKFNSAHFNRRKFLKQSALTSTGLLTLPAFFTSAVGNASEGLFYSRSSDLEILLTAQPRKVSLFTGKSTEALCYYAQVINGDAGAVVTNAGYFGPTFRFKQGQRVKIKFQNKLQEKSIIHWHGLHLPEKYDSHPSYSIEPGNSFDYEFTVNQRPGFYWYHPHPHGRTAYQIYHGLAGMIIVESAEENKIGLPSGEMDLAYCIQDRLFDENNQLSYLKNGGHDLMMGMMGDTLFLNGETKSIQKVKQDAYRIRILNASNARFYKLAWSDGKPLSIIGTDGGLLEKPEERPYLYLAPGERLEIFRSFRELSLGSDIELQSLPFGNNGGNAYTVIPFRVDGAGVTKKELPDTLMPVEKLDPQLAVNFENPKRFIFEMKQNLGWTIDGLTYEMNKSRPKETIKLGTMEVWEFESKGMMAMPHPVHVHGSQFQVVSRSGEYDPGFLDIGWKDTVFIAGGQSVQIVKRFDDYKGYFPFHCHNLEHGSEGMMRDFHVV